MSESVSREDGEVLLTEDHVYFGGMNLTYELRMITERVARRFLIRVEKADEFCVAELGGDLVRAVEHYRRVVDGTVTPCALEDVLQDIQYA